MRTVHIAGGGRGIGRWLAEKVFSPRGRVFCYDTEKSTLSALPSSVTGCLVDESDGYTRYEEQFQTGDWILLGVPFPALASSIRALAGVAKAGSLFASLASVQAESARILHADVPGHCTHLGCHPLFGHNVPSAVGQTVALTGFDGSNGQHREFRRWLELSGLITTELSPEAHDQSMSIVQALTHFCLIGVAAMLTVRGRLPSELLKLRTPNFQFLHAFACRVIKLSATTTGSIQATAEASAVRTEFIEILTDLHRSLRDAGDTAGCAKVIERVRQPWTAADVNEGAEVASVGVDSIQRLEEMLHQYKISGSPLTFRHRTTGKLHIVRVIESRQDDVVFEESTKEVQVDGRSYQMSGVSEAARRNYQKAGYSLPIAKRGVIKKRNVKLLSSEDLGFVHREGTLPIDTVATFSNPYGYHEEYCERALPLLVKDLWRCEFLDCYRRRSETERITLKLTFNPSADRAALIAAVRRAVEEREPSS